MKHTTNTTKFKLVCFFSHKLCGTPFTGYEKSINRNRRYIDSYDYEHIKGGVTVTRHDKAFDKLLQYVQDHWATIDRAMLILNDHAEQKEIRVAYWDKHNQQKNQTCELAFDQQGNHFICMGAVDGGILTQPMRITVTNYKPKNVAV